jgi:hypothetical protein
MDSTGFNVFAIGESGTGKMSTVMYMLRQKAANEEAPADWCYVHNFKDPDSSIALSFGPGKGAVFQKELEEMIKILSSRYRRPLNPRNTRPRRARSSTSSSRSSRSISPVSIRRRRRGFHGEAGADGGPHRSRQESGELCRRRSSTPSTPRPGRSSRKQDVSFRRN